MGRPVCCARRTRNSPAPASLAATGCAPRRPSISTDPTSSAKTGRWKRSSRPIGTGAFNFLLGGIYSDLSLSENSYFVNSFGIDYLAGVLGSFTALGNPPAAGGPLPPSYLGSPFFRNNTDQLNVTSYGLFGEAYFNFTDSLKLTVGVRYNNDEKDVRARSTLASFLVPYSLRGDIFSSPFVGSFDADPGLAGNQLFQERDFADDQFTGRAVLDWQVTPDNLLYFSVSRGV